MYSSLPAQECLVFAAMQAPAGEPLEDATPCNCVCVGAHPSEGLLSISQPHHDVIFKNCTTSNLLKDLVEPVSARWLVTRDDCVLFFFFFPYRSCRL